MNFLAHSLLAHQIAIREDTGNAAHMEGLLAGAVIGDFVKGPIPIHWPRALHAGVALHRRVDALSTHNQALGTVIRSFSEDLRRFAPIFVDLLADYALASRWDECKPPADLPTFSRMCYAAIDAYQDNLLDLEQPHERQVMAIARFQRFFAYMTEVDLLASYGTWNHALDGSAAVLRRLEKKALQPAVAVELENARPLMLTALPAFLTEMQDGLSDWNV